MDAYAFTAVAMAGALLSWFFVVLLGLLLNILIGFVTDQIISASPWIHPWGLADGKCS